MPLILDEDYSGRVGTVLGWGQLELEGEFPDRLQQVDIPVLDNKSCRRDSLYQSYEITENMFCAGFMSGEKDACKVLTRN